MKLLLDNIIFQLQRVGGISIYWSELLSRILNDINIDTTFIPIKNENENYIRNELVAKFPEYLQKNKWNPLLNHRYAPIINSGNNSFDIFHSSYYRPYIGKSTKQVVTVHDFMYELFDSGIRRKVHSIQKRMAITNADIIICISENTKKDLLKFYPEFSNKDIRIVYNGVGETFRPLKKSIEFTSRPYLLVVGNRVGCKNFGATINAYTEELYKKYDLVIVGKPLNDDEEKKLAPYSKYITIKTNVPEHKLNELYNNASALIFPSTYEGFGIPVIEAMKAGCPVITTKCSCMKEVAGNAGIYINSLDGNGIVEAVKRLTNFEYTHDIIELGLKQASKFSWDKTYHEVKKIYAELYESIK